MSSSKRLQGKPKPRPQTLIVRDIAIRDAQRMCSKNIKVLHFSKDMLSDLRESYEYCVRTCDCEDCCDTCRIE